MILFELFIFLTDLPIIKRHLPIFYFQLLFFRFAIHHRLLHGHLLMSKVPDLHISVLNCFLQLLKWPLSINIISILDTILELVLVMKILAVQIRSLPRNILIQFNIRLSVTSGMMLWRVKYRSLFIGLGLNRWNRYQSNFFSLFILILKLSLLVVIFV